MNNQLKCAVPAITAVVLMLGITSCEDGQSRTNPTFAWINDPPRLALIADGKLVVVEFNWFGVGYKVRQLTGAVVPLGVSKPSDGRMAAVGRDGGGTIDPDPDEHEMCPDLWPDPDDEFPFPDPPLPMPDYPDEDPFDGLPEPPPFDPSDLSFTNLNDGTLSSTTTGGSDFPHSVGPQPFYASSDTKLASSSKLNIGGRPAGIVGTPDGLRMLIAYSQGIAVVDKKSRTVVDRIPLPGGSVPYGIAVTPDGKTAYVTSFVRSSAELYVVDLASKRVITSFISGAFAARVTMKPDGTQAWFTSLFDDSVTVIDVLSNTLGVRIAGIVNAWDIRFNPTGTRAYVSGPVGSGDVVSVIDTSTYTVIAKVPVGANPRTLIVTPSGRHVFVANYGADSIMQIDTATNKVVRTIVVGKKPQGFQFLP